MEQMACVPAHVSYFLCCTRKSNAAFTLGANVQYSLGTNVNTLFSTIPMLEFGYGAGARVQGLSCHVFFLAGGGRGNFCAAHVQQRSYSIHEESFSRTPKLSKREKGSAG